MITPNEAYILSVQGIETKFKDDVQEIFKLIEQRANNGMFCIYYKASICNLTAIKTLFIHYGYSVEMNVSECSLAIWWNRSA